MRTFHKDLLAAFETEYAQRTPIAKENIPFNPPANTPWIRLSFRQGESAQVTLGPGSRVRHSGSFIVDVYCPIGEGTERSDWLVDRIVPMLDRKRVAGATFRVPSYSPGRDEGNGWFVRSITFPYILDGTV